MSRNATMNCAAAGRGTMWIKPNGCRPAQRIADCAAGRTIAAATPRASAEKQRLTRSLASNSDLVARSGTNRSTTKSSPNKLATTTRVIRAGIIGGNRFREGVPHPTDSSLPDPALGSNSWGLHIRAFDVLQHLHRWMFTVAAFSGTLASVIYNRVIAQPPPIA